jgi:hypothetical protein
VREEYMVCGERIEITLPSLPIWWRARDIHSHRASCRASKGP